MALPHVNIFADNEDSELDDENEKQTNEEINDDSYCMSESVLLESQNDYEISETDQEMNDTMNDIEISIVSEPETEPNESEEGINEEQRLRRTTRINAGTGVQRTHAFVQFTMKNEDDEETKSVNAYNKVINVLFTQVSAKEGINDGMKRR